MGGDARITAGPSSVTCSEEREKTETADFKTEILNTWVGVCVWRGGVFVQALQ